MEIKPTLLFVITQGSWGGAQRYVADLVSRFDQDYTCVIAMGEAKGSRDLANHLPKNTCRVIYLKHLVRAISPWHDSLAIKELHTLYNTLKPDIVHLNSSKTGIIGSLAVVGLQNKPKIIYTVHGWVFNELLGQFKKNIYLFLEKWTAHFKDAIIVLSPQEKKDAIKTLHIQEEKIHLIPLGIDPPHFLSKSSAREKILELANLKECSGPLIGTIANVYKNKGLDILIAAAHQIVSQKDSLNETRDKPNAHFFIIGSGPEESNLKKIITTQKITNVHLLGNYNNAAELLPAFDLFVLPSRKEGLPYTILEAMAARLPIIATKVGGLPSLTNRYDQLELVESNNIMALAESISKKIIEKKPAALTDSFSNSLSEMVSNTAGLYRTVLMNRTRR